MRRVKSYLRSTMLTNLCLITSRYPPPDENLADIIVRIFGPPCISTGALAPWAVCRRLVVSGRRTRSLREGSVVADLFLGGGISPPIQVCCGRAALSVAGCSIVICE